MKTDVGGSSRGTRWSGGFRSFIRRKQVDSVHVRREGYELAKRLSAVDLIAIGVGSTIGAGVYVLVGTVAREQAGPALTISFLIAGIAAALSAFCYTELACRCPSAGSAYHYAYICVGEGVAWLIGWALMLEYTIGGSAVARGMSPNLALFFGGENKLPVFIARHTIPKLGMVVDPCAAILILIVTGLLCIGIKESSLVQTIVTTVNVCAMAFIVMAGGYLGFKNGWTGYELPSGYFPFGVNGMLAGSGIVFFSYIGFDAVTSTAEEVNNPQRDLSLGIGIAVCICCILYMLVSIVIVGLVPYSELDPDTPVSSAFASYGMTWAVYIITTGAVTALCATLMGSLLPQGVVKPGWWSHLSAISFQPRTLMAMARDGLLPSFFSDINKHTQVPVKSTVLTGIFAATLAFFMDVSQLAGMVSVGTLLAFTTSAVSVLILRYVPPDVVPLPLSLQKSIDSLSFSHEMERENPGPDVGLWEDNSRHLLVGEETLVGEPLIEKNIAHDEQNKRARRKFAAWSIALICLGVLILASAASAEYLASFPRFTVCAVGGFLLLCGLVVLVCTGQDVRRHSFGHTGGFICPFVPFMPAACIMINIYLLINLGRGTWIRVSIWLAIGAIIYVLWEETQLA